MDMITTHLEDARAEIRDLAAELVQEFMGNRSVRRANPAEFSDLVVRCESIGNHLRIEWRRRIWLQNPKPGAQKFYPRYVRYTEVLRYAKPYEKDEVRIARDRLRVLQEKHSELLKMESLLQRHGLTLEKADRLAGLMPDDVVVEHRDGQGRFRKKK